MNPRLIGLLCIAAGLACGWFFILTPLDALRAGERGVKVYQAAFAVAPGAIMAGLIVLIGGQRAYDTFFTSEVVGTRNKILNWAMIGLIIIAAGAGFWWFDQQVRLIGAG